MKDSSDELRLEECMRASYRRSLRTAFLILGDRADAEDAVQDAYLRAWRFRDSINSTSSARPWLYRVVVNSCYSRLRDEIPRRDLRAPEGELATLRDAHDHAAHVGVALDVTAALRDLAPDLRVVVVLRYYADLSEREIATAIGRPTGTVKSRLHEARRRLAQHSALRPESPGTTGDTQEDQA